MGIPEKVISYIEFMENNGYGAHYTLKQCRTRAEHEMRGQAVDEPAKVTKVGLHQVMSNSIHLSTASDLPTPNGIDYKALEIENALEYVEQLRVLGVEESLIEPLIARIQQMLDQNGADLRAGSVAVSVEVQHMN